MLPLTLEPKSYQTLPSTLYHVTNVPIKFVVAKSNI